jgi:hypothetical protein
MSGIDSSLVRSLLVATLRPIAAMLLKFGIGYREFMDAAKEAFVDAASKEFGSDSRPLNISRVAVMTGLSRREIRSVRALRESNEEEGAEPTHLPAEVLRQWFTSASYCDSEGSPKPLPWDGTQGSFSDLVRSCGSSLSPVAMRAELLRVGAVRVGASGELVALRRYFIADSARDRLAEGLRFGIRPIALTVAHNVSTDDPNEFRFQRVVDSYSIPAEKKPDLEKEIARRLKAYSEELDDLLAESADPKCTTEGSALGVGLFYFQDGN